MAKHFIQALEDVQKWQDTTVVPVENKICAEALQHSERFYMPDAVNIIDGRKFGEDIKEVCRLPYDCISLLSAYNFEGYSKTALKISVAFNVDGKQNSRFKWVQRQESFRGWIGMSIICHPASKEWVHSPSLVKCCFPEGEEGIHLTRIDTATETDFERLTTVTEDSWMRECYEDVHSLMNLCVLLSLHNVQSCNVKVPYKINAKRFKKRKAKLPDYSVLVLNGEKLGAKAGGKRPLSDRRSHLRRGHIRRLSEDRRIWVNSCLVRGKSNGFLAKEYRVNNVPNSIS